MLSLVFVHHYVLKSRAALCAICPVPLPALPCLCLLPALPQVYWRAPVLRVVKDLKKSFYYKMLERVTTESTLLQWILPSATNAARALLSSAQRLLSRWVDTCRHWCHRSMSPALALHASPRRPVCIKETLDAESRTKFTGKNYAIREAAPTFSEQSGADADLLAV